MNYLAILNFFANLKSSITPGSTLIENFPLVDIYQEYYFRDCLSKIDMISLCSFAVLNYTTGTVGIRRGCIFEEGNTAGCINLNPKGAVLKCTCFGDACNRLNLTREIHQQVLGRTTYRNM